MIKIEITLDEIKEVLRIDYDDEDIFLQTCLETAKAFLEDSIDDYEEKIIDENFQKKAKLVIILVVQDFFDNRSFAYESKNNQAERMKYLTQSLLFQMRWG